MSSFLHDVRHALRHWRRQPGFAVVVVLTLALGIGANAAIFSVLDAVLLQPLPYDQPERLIQVYSQFPSMGFDHFWMSPPEVLELERWATSYEHVGAYVLGSENVAGGERPLRADVAYLTAGLWPTLGVEAIRGRTFTPEEDRPGAALVAVLSHDFWARAFGSDPDLVGATLEVDGQLRTVVGILPPEVDLEDAGVEVWLPLALDPADPGGRGSHYLTVIARLADGVGVTRAEEELGALVLRWEEEFPDTHSPSRDNHPLRLKPLKEELIGDVRPAMLLLAGAVGLVLLIACANVANLLLARAEARQREIAVRTALGASHGRLLRQFFTESVLLALTGGGVGLALAFWSLQALMRAFPGSVPRLGELALDGRVVLFTLGTSIVTGVLFGLAPALHARGRAFFSALREGGRSGASVHRQRLRRGLVIAEVALAVVLVVGAGLLLKSFWTLTRVDPGFEAGDVLSFQLELPAASYPEPEQVTGFFSRLLERLESLPGVESAAVATGLPPSRRLDANDTEFEGLSLTEDGPAHNVDYYQAVSAGYFATLGIPVEEGRVFSELDSPDGAPVVVVNRTLAQTFYPGENPVGKRLRRGWSNPEIDEPWHSVTGVVADVKQGGIDQDTGTEVYFLYHQLPSTVDGAYRTMNVVVRTAIPPLGLVPVVRDEMARLDASLPLANVRTLDAVVADSMTRPRFLSVLVALFGALALLLAAVGTYGVLSYAVEQRRFEMGVRFALGARGSSVLMLILRQGLVLVAAGVALGLVLAFLLRRTVAGLLYGVEPADPLTYAVVTGVLLLVALVACLLPAGRAMRTDPVIALRSE